MTGKRERKPMKTADEIRAAYYESGKIRAPQLKYAKTIECLYRRYGPNSPRYAELELEARMLMKRREAAEIVRAVRAHQKGYEK